MLFIAIFGFSWIFIIVKSAANLSCLFDRIGNVVPVGVGLAVFVEGELRGIDELFDEFFGEAGMRDQCIVEANIVRIE